MVKLSIIIPYYKTLDLTKDLLQKLIPQKTNDVEIILIDDGCNEKALDVFKDNVIIEHLKENKGGAGATNVGLDIAKGSHIALIDSDDMISDDYIETILKTIDERDEDLLYMDWQDMFTSKVIRRPNNYAPWKCVYKKDIMPRFIEGWIYSYDVPFQEELNKKNLSKYYMDKVLYYYNSTRPDNLTHKKAELIAKGE